jgi:hypothetical protein
MSAIDRILASFEALTKLFTRRLPAAFVWRYSVEEVTETSFSGRRLSPLCPFDDMPNIPLMPGIAGAGIAPKVGSVALVAFLDGDPSLPRCVGWDQAVPSSLTLDVSGKLHLAPTASGVVQVGDDSAPTAQAVALAPAVASFASAATTLATASATLEAAAGAMFVAIGATVPAPPSALGAGSPALTTALGTFATALTAYLAAVSSFTSAVGALAGTFPTGFAATKLSTK